MPSASRKRSLSEELFPEDEYENAKKIKIEEKRAIDSVPGAASSGSPSNLPLAGSSNTEVQLSEREQIAKLRFRKRNATKAQEAFPAPQTTPLLPTGSKELPKSARTEETVDQITQEWGQFQSVYIEQMKQMQMLARNVLAQNEANEKRFTRLEKKISGLKEENRVLDGKVQELEKENTKLRSFALFEGRIEKLEEARDQGGNYRLMPARVNKLEKDLEALENARSKDINKWLTEIARVKSMITDDKMIHGMGFGGSSRAESGIKPSIEPHSGEPGNKLAIEPRRGELRPRPAVELIQSAESIPPAENADLGLKVKVKRATTSILRPMSSQVSRVGSPNTQGRANPKNQGSSANRKTSASVIGRESFPASRSGPSAPQNDRAGGNNTQVGPKPGESGSVKPKRGQPGPGTSAVKNSSENHK
jgi:hypothetical protein